MAPRATRRRATYAAMMFDADYDMLPCRLRALSLFFIDATFAMPDAVMLMRYAVQR